MKVSKDENLFLSHAHKFTECISNNSKKDFKCGISNLFLFIFWIFHLQVRPWQSELCKPPGMTWLSLLIGPKVWSDLRPRLTKLKCFQCWSLSHRIIPAPNELQLDSHPDTFFPHVPFLHHMQHHKFFLKQFNFSFICPRNAEAQSSTCGVLKRTPRSLHDLCFAGRWTQISLAVTLGFFHTSLSILCCAFGVLLDEHERATTKSTYR